MSNFGSTVEAWTRKVNNRLEFVPKIASQRVANDVRIPIFAGGNMPYLTGNLSRSLEASLGSMPIGNLDPGDKERLPDPGGQITGVISSMDVGQTLYLGFRVHYAQAQERRRAFVRLTAQKWQFMVADVVKQVSKS